MPDSPPPRAFAVSLFFEGQVGMANVVAGTEAEAVALVAVSAARQHDTQLVGVGVMPLEAEWMRWALRTLETGEVHKAPVISLVSDNLRQPGAPKSTLQHGACSIHDWKGSAWEVCPHCALAQLHNLTNLPADPA